MSDAVYDYENIAQKRMGAVAIILDENGNVLIMKPTYRDDWLLPGGIVDKDESPYAACKRELLEELGMECELKGLICIDYLSATGGVPEGVHFVFDGGVFTQERIDSIQIPHGEIEEFRFVSPEESLSLASDIVGGRMLECVKAAQDGSPIYMEDQVKIF